MSTSPRTAADLPPPSRARARLGLQSVVVMLAVTACCLFAGLIAARYPKFIDATSTRAHRLSARSLATLERLTGPTDLVVTINSAAIDARSAERTRDVLDTFDRASDRLSVTIVDVAAADGAARLDQAWSRVEERYRDAIDRQRGAIEASAGAAVELAAALERVAALMADADQSVREGEPGAEGLKRFLTQTADFSRLGAKDVSDAATRARDLLATPIGRSPVPTFDAAAAALRSPLPTLASQLSQVAKTVDTAAAVTNEQVPAAVRDRLKPLGPELGQLRDRLARLEEALTSLPRLPLVNVARVLERTSAALVIGPPAQDGAGRDLAAVEIEALFPPRQGEGGEGQPRIDLRARTEELIGAALASLVNPAPPIVVLLHGENARLAPEFSRFSQVFERLRLRGMDVVEWPVWLDKDLPPLTKLNPRGDRPVVYATIYTVPETPDAAARYISLTRTVESLVASGRPVLMSANPSTMPAIGQTDAMFEFLGGPQGLGLSVDSGRPLLRRAGTPASPAVAADTLITPTGGTHPIVAAVNGLRIRLPWAIPLGSETSAPAAITPLLTVTPSEGAWAESQWIEFRSVPAAQRGFIRPQDLPKPDSQRDDATGPWTVAAAVERKLPDRPAPQRLVIVGSNGWFLDEIAEAAAVVDNRRVLINPGNTELFEACIYWLAGQDDAIGASPQAEAAPTIPPLSAGTIAAIRWSLIGGLPLLILLCGAVWRLIRG